MTNGEKIQTILNIDKDCTEVYGKNGMMTFSVTQDWWEEECKEPTTKNDLEVDCISRKQAIDAFSDLLPNIGYNKKAITEILQEVPPVTPQEPRWIPVSERLPVTNDEVLVTYIVNGNTKKRYVETANCFDGEWSSVNDEYRIPNTRVEILAWCEMPKPYREVKE